MVPVVGAAAGVAVAERQGLVAAKAVDRQAWAAPS